MAQVTSLIITRKSETYWICLSNLSPDSRDANAYSGTRNGDLLTIKTRTGAILYQDVYFDVIDYIDEMDSDNNLTDPSSAQEVQQHLIAQGFYEGSTGGGTGGVTTFKALGDVNVPSFMGRNKYFIRIDEAGMFLEAIPWSVVQRFQDLSNWLGGELQPGKYITTSQIVDEEGESTGLQQSDIDQIINTPIPWGALRVAAKGATEVDGMEVANGEDFVLEVGDLVEGWKDGFTYWTLAMYNGGDPADRDNYTEIIGNQIR